MNYLDFAFVIDKNNNPCMPIYEGYAGKLLRSKKAIIVNHDPLVIQRHDEYDAYLEFRDKITLKVDTGYENIGFSVSDNKHEYLSGQVKLLNGISDRLLARKGYRNCRRQRLRYRRNKNADYKTINNPTYKNGNQDGWSAPSILHRINSHLRLVDKIASWIPIDKVIIETANFDIQKIKAILNDKEIEGVEYQLGEMYGFENVKQYVRERDNYTCQICKAGQDKNKKNVPIEVHHITPRSKGGSNKPDNLISLCKTCHKKVHMNNNDNDLFRKLKHDGVKNTYKDASFMNIMRWALYNELKEKYDVSMSYGYITKLNRRMANLKKYHYTDALCISDYHEITLTKNIYLVEQKRCNDRCMESFFDAKYIDSRDNKIKKGNELCKVRKSYASKRSTRKEDIENNRIFRKEKVEKGRRQYECHSYCLKPGDLVYINYGKHKVKIAEFTTMQKTPTGSYKIKFIYDGQECKNPSISIKPEEYNQITTNQCNKIKIVRTRRGMIWRKTNRLEYESNTPEQYRP